VWNDGKKILINQKEKIMNLSATVVTSNWILPGVRTIIQLGYINIGSELTGSGKLELSDKTMTFCNTNICVIKMQ